MSDSKQRNRIVLNAVARRFSATWEKGGNLSGAYLRHAGKRVAIDLRTLTRPGAVPDGAMGAHLRFDQVATRLLERLRAALRETVPDGITVLLTVTAPIHLASKTAAALEAKIQTLLARRPLAREATATFHGNRVRIRLMRGPSRRAPKMIGFVHNPDSDPRRLFDMTREWLELPSAASGRRAPRLAADRWLVVNCARGISCLEAYRAIASQSRSPAGFRKILLVFGDGRIEELTE